MAQLDVPWVALLSMDSFYKARHHMKQHESELVPDLCCRFSTRRSLIWPTTTITSLQTVSVSSSPPHLVQLRRAGRAGFRADGGIAQAAEGRQAR